MIEESTRRSRGCIQDGGKTRNDVRCREMGSEESPREEAGCRGNDDVEMDVWSHRVGQNKE